MKAGVLLVAVLAPAMLLAQRGGGRSNQDPTLNGPIPAAAPAYGPALFEAMRMRNVGPTTGGRVSDLAVDPKNQNIWYVAAASSGLWKTVNHGVTFTPIFENYGSFSLGVVVIDPNNSNVIWLGTGENNAQRSVDFGDGVYKSTDAGRTWTNVGLKNSEHIGKILIDPRNSDVVYVASQGPLWAPGGDRGLYKTTDGGKTWATVLTAGENTGVSDLALPPCRNGAGRRARIGALQEHRCGEELDAAPLRTADSQPRPDRTRGLPAERRRRVRMDESRHAAASGDQRGSSQ
jgi:hypothetical protein